MVKAAKRDHGQAWWILFCGFICNTILDGIIFSFGVYYQDLLNHFGEGHGKTSFIGSIISGVYALVGPIASILVNKYGCKFATISGSLIAATGFIISTFSPNVICMTLSYGVIGGFGLGLMYLSVYVIIGNWFENRRAFATGIASCGSGVGTFIFNPLSMVLIEVYGWRGAIWITAGVLLNGVVFGMNFEEFPEKKSSEKSDLEANKKKLIDWSLFANVPFMMFCTSSFLCLLGFFIPFMYLPDYTMKKGFNRTQGSLLVSVIGASNVIGRIVCGWVSDKTWANPLKIYNLALIVGGTSTMIAAFISSYEALIIYSIVFGIAVAAYVSLCAIILVEFLGLEKLSNSFGFLNMFRGIATLIGAPMAGFLYDMTGRYEEAFIVGGAAILLSGLICVPLRMVRKCVKTCKPCQSNDSNEKNNSYTEDEVIKMTKSLHDKNIQKKLFFTQNKENSGGSPYIGARLAAADKEFSISQMNVQLLQ